VIAQTSLLILLPIVAVFSLTRRRRVVAVIGMGSFSLLLSAVYLLLHAPDVAVTEAAIGAALVTFIYVLAIRKTGRLVAVGDEAPGLLEREGDQINGLEHAILHAFARHLGMDLIVHLSSAQDARDALERGEADIGAGGIVSSDTDRRVLATSGFLETAFFRVEGPGTRQGSANAAAGTTVSDVTDAIRAGRPCAVTLDLARFMAVSRLDLSAYRVSRLPDMDQYVFLVATGNEELHRQLEAFLTDLKRSGRLATLVRRYIL
jgi:uncharacterized MnhB-related membrane protein